MYLFGTTLSGRTLPVVEPHVGVWVQSVFHKESDVSIMVNTVTLMAVARSISDNKAAKISPYGPVSVTEPAGDTVKPAMPDGST